MAWVVTLNITDCANSSTLAGATVSDGTYTYFADANGQFIAVIDDYWSDYVVSIGKANYYNRNFAMSRATMAGTRQSVCLNAAPPPPPTEPNGDGW
jgi:hypothetical protein